MVNSLWRALADAVVGVHYAYMAYLVVGGFAAWRWRKTIWLHVAAVIWAALIVTTKVPCPLTALQNHFREDAGLRPLTSSFINLYIRGTFYPDDQQTLAQIVLGVIVIVSWIGFVRRKPTQRRSVPTLADANAPK
jgi:hypothetical protein